MGTEALRHWSVGQARPDSSLLDPVTLLPNRRQYLIDAADWRGASHTTLVLVTLADPQAFTDLLRVLGHARAEAFVKSGASRLASIVGRTVYHVDGLSFAFRLPGCVEPLAPSVIERLVTAFREPIICEDVPIDVRIGIGLKGLTDPNASPHEELRAALAAATDSRAEKRNWAWFNRMTDAAHRRAFRLLSDLKAALTSDTQLALHYQPKVRLATGQCTSVEALLRWTHPQLGPVAPSEIVGLAETTALVTPMTRWIIDAATRQAALWSRDHLDLSVAINVSPKNLEEADFVEYLLFCCSARGLDRARVELEITEEIGVAATTQTLERLRTLRNFGFSVAIDDFGSGYSNMNYLTRLSANILKLDRSLVHGVAMEERADKLVSNIIRMGRDLGYSIVAEGIETEEQRRLLQSWGCDMGQGWHFGRPMTPDAFRTWLDAAAA